MDWSNITEKPYIFIIYFDWWIGPILQKNLIKKIFYWFYKIFFILNWVYNLQIEKNI